VAGEGTDKQDLSEATHEPRECMACRGTGRVISNLGGSPSTVACPWCDGSGLRPAEVDAQAHWARESGSEPQTGESAGTGTEPGAA
jgi:DnaJ-class molecular chaperone